MELAGVDTDRSDLGTASMLSEASTEGEGDDEREAGEVAFETGDVSAAVAAIVAVGGRQVVGQRGQPRRRVQSMARVGVVQRTWMRQ